jgi:general stress protein 26
MEDEEMMRDPAQTIGNLIDHQSTALIASVDANGFPNVKAMGAPAKREGIRTFYWHTNSPSMRVVQYRENPKACIYFFDKRFGARGVQLLGTMEVIDDIDVKRGLWRDEFSVYYTGGADGGDFIVLKFTAVSGRYYTKFKSENFEV